MDNPRSSAHDTYMSNTNPATAALKLHLGHHTHEQLVELAQTSAVAAGKVDGWTVGFSEHLLDMVGAELAERDWLASL